MLDFRFVIDGFREPILDLGDSQFDSRLPSIELSFPYHSMDFTGLGEFLASGRRALAEQANRPGREGGQGQDDTPVKQIFKKGELNRRHRRCAL